MKKILSIIILSCLLAGCETRTERRTNDEIISDKEVVLLFEYDSVKVYRFYDHGHYIYFTNTPGKVEYTRSYHAGKNIRTEKVQTLCNK